MKKNQGLTFLCLLLLAFIWAGLSGGFTVAQAVGDTLSPWTGGMLDIHQISTGRGNSAFFILPDGTTMLVDAGELGSRTERHVEPRPDDSRKPGEWIARYIRRAHPERDNPIIDYAILTHFHDDHMGNGEKSSLISKSGEYRLSGITEVAEYLGIRKILDRGWPDYSYPRPLKSGNMDNYRKFLEWQAQKNGMVVERFQPGRADQITLLKNQGKYSNFEIRNVTANGEVWTGVGNNTRKHFPPLEEVREQDFPSENPCSIGFLLSYGSFDYFSGGDITGIPSPGGPAWHDVETPAARAVGPVEAAVLNHHGYIDSQNEFYVRTLHPRAWIIPVWDSAHPTSAVYARLRSTRLYPGTRDIFSTSMHPANKVVVNGLDKLASDQGHILIRVSPGGDEFRVIIISDADESMEVKSIHGPWKTR